METSFSSDYGATLTTLSPTDTKYSSSMKYSIIDAQIFPDGSTVAVIQSGKPALYDFGSNEAYIRYSPNPASGASATWSSLYPPTVGQSYNIAGTYKSAKPFRETIWRAPPWARLPSSL